MRDINLLARELKSEADKIKESERRNRKERWERKKEENIVPPRC